MTTNENRKNASTTQRWAVAVSHYGNGIWNGTKRAKGFMYAGTSFKLDCKMRDLIVESIIEQLGEIQSCFEIDNKRKIILFKFIDNESKQKEKKIDLKSGQNSIEFLETSEYNDEYKFIAISSYTRLSVWQVSQAVYDNFKAIGEVVDITAFKQTKFNSYPSKSIKVVIKTKKSDEIPKTLKINDIKVVYLWKGDHSVCTYFKKNEHWKYICPVIKLKNEKKNRKDLGIQIQKT
ncbi:hypothetical protein AYI70_g5821 [Smittium culicis]|uniref:Uncharacterized protein n=1 Tax=Smittium culicis TaxID=133412 RepID=A0A1R1XSS7_9FUNG|nr:hypothetical protein AYI70_g5971 [Smittium culicis]OMJ17666.1 hypothetical protein AYI70_g5821 [Smittium culicis]